MSDDGFFDDELDSAFLNEVDAIEAAASVQVNSHQDSAIYPPKRHRTPPSVIELSDGSDAFDSFTLDDEALQQIDRICSEQLNGSRQPPAGPSRPSRPTTKGSIQTTLFGEIAQPHVSGSKKSFQRTHSKTLPKEEKRTKQWDHTSFAKTGWKSSKVAGKGKASFGAENESEAEEEEVEFEQFPAPSAIIEPPPPMKLVPDLLSARRWIYPLNKPKREYQFNIVKESLFENTLVALPTGLGKTFIAGVIMLNYYNWFPDGKVVFVAPTKPLVAQQIDACHKVCGIPGSHAAELTGQVSAPRRVKAWQEKRVFFMTPQTLMNDLRRGNCDPRDIVLLVVDEAHRGTGDYAYAQVVRFLMAKNPHFRVLALTATPGGDIEAVQRVVDALHISHIAIRSEKSPDITPYLHIKHVKLHLITMTEEFAKLRDMLSKVMQEFFQPLLKLVQSNGLLSGHPDPVMLHPFRCQIAMKEMHVKKSPRHLFSPIQQLGKLSRAMSYLLESSMSMFYGCLSSIVTGDDDSSAKKSGKASQSALAQNANFQAVIREAEGMKASGFPLHPKMDKMKTLLIDHFVRDAPENDDGQLEAGGKDSRVMVFVTFRECVDEVVAYLNVETPLLRATRFIGQGVDKQGNRGFAQSEQLDVIKKFKAGEYNVLVSTSIGEEGLDIGEVDLIVCYDAQKTPIRMLQRVGRTGRKRAGYVHVLLSEGREEKNWDKAQESYDEVQFSIEQCDKLEFYGDVERLLPSHIKPECVEMEMEIEEHVREDSRSKKGSFQQSPGHKGKKRKRDDDPARNMPPGTASGFVSARDLVLTKGVKKRKKAEKEFDPLLGEDDEDDLDIEAGLEAPRRTLSTSALYPPSKPKAKLKRASTNVGAKREEKREKTSKRANEKKKAKEPSTPSLSQFDKVGADDSDDMAIEKGLWSSPSPQHNTSLPALSPFRSPQPQRSSSVEFQAPLSKKPRTPDVIDLTTPDTLHRTNIPVRNTNPFSPRSRHVEQDVKSHRSGQLSPLYNLSNSPEQSPVGAPRSLSPIRSDPDASMAWLIADDDEPSIQLIGSSPLIPRTEESRTRRIDIGSISQSIDFTPALGSSPPLSLDSAPQSPQRSPSSRNMNISCPQSVVNMPPPALPARLTLPSPTSDDSFPPLTYAVRAPGKQARKRPLVQTLDSSPLAMPPPSQRRLQRPRDSSSPTPVGSPKTRPHTRKKLKFKDYAEAQKANPWMDVEAVHSGDERDIGSSDVDELGDESDRQFVEELPETQVSPSYDQSAVYRRSLFTQAPGSTAALPQFASRPARREGHALIERERRPIILSSPPPADSDDYVYGSFVVDDADISYIEQPSSEP